jgi:hypothetical protein
MRAYVAQVGEVVTVTQRVEHRGVVRVQVGADGLSV